jgi:two-component system sensor histidine kinase DegS
MHEVIAMEIKEIDELMTDRCDSLLRAQETERSYMARELHDGVAQSTLQLGLQVGICRKYLEDGQLDRLASELDRLEEQSQFTSNQVRELISDMRRPMVEADANLDDYIKHIIEIHEVRGGPPVTYQSTGSGNMPDFSSQSVLALGRIIQEALLNIRKHARAQSVWLTCSLGDDRYTLSIVDDGRGIDHLEINSQPLDKGGAGLAGMRLRAEALGGTLNIGRNITGQGTALTFILPK